MHLARKATKTSNKPVPRSIYETCTMSSTHLDNELKQVQNREQQAYMHLRRQLGLDPIPEQQDTSTSLPPPIPPRNPARGAPYVPKHIDARNLTLDKDITQKQKEDARAGFITRDAGPRNQATETLISRDKTAKTKSPHVKPSLSMDNLSDAIDSALQDWADISTHNG
ncbi:hypothetical protein V8C44DRAFT_69472 [Trichoderma aethiopicum]